MTPEGYGLAPDNAVYNFSVNARKSISVGQFQDIKKEMDTLIKLGKDKAALVASIELYAIRAFTLIVKHLLAEKAPQLIPAEIDKYEGIGINRQKLEAVAVELLNK